MSKITVTTIAGQTSGGDANKVKIESGDDLEVVSGDLTVDTNTLHVNATDNRVGIGTTSPSYPLTISHATTAYHHSTNGTAQSVSGVDSANTNIIGTISNHDLRFITNTTEQGRITAAGVHTKPNQPAFHIQGTGPAHSAGQETAIYYVSTPTIKFNVGNHGVGGTSSSTSGKFTCPVAGMYLVCCTWYRGNSGSPTAYMGTIVKKNGSSFYSYWYNNAANYGDASVGQTGIIQCAANDVLQQYVYGNSADSDPGTTMQIYFLG